ncbi:hypothetical protein KLP40_14375 [Hymenobacter sp. NST-14]|uniref:hypothetical protein n=1 Tax=Hymenobacter piscis TaxID=2839984 RepID=UPI001C018898|nr:hypothetical protein [Hymenobacter piscis]MBT9394353.1 hypothetical protein [Hymenobacter piscis]
MVPVTSIPTETLYKFLTIGSILAILASSVLFVNQWQKTSQLDIKYATAIRLYEHKQAITERERKELLREMKFDSAQQKAMRQVRTLANRLAKKQGWPAMKEFSVTFDNIHFTDESKYNEYLDKLQAKSAANFNKKLEALNQVVEKSNEEAIRLGEQSQLLEQNSYYLGAITALWLGLVFISAKALRYGIRKWHEMQTVNDELMRMQLRKATAEAAEVTPATTTETESTQPAA